jgi:hypothetical protein
VSSDVGAGPFNISMCSGSGDNGALQNTGTNCTGPDDAYIEDIKNSDGTRSTNYTGSLADTFSCIAQLGITGCGFEQHLESMRRALNGSNPANQNFLRPNAFLAVIIIADEDDCSTQDTSMFDTSQNSASDPLGFLTSFRCYEFGIDCETGNDDPRAPGPRTNCFPRDPSPYMYGVQEYVDFLKGLKPDDESLVIVAGISGNPEPVVVGTDPENPQHPALVPSCTSAAGKADPAIRLKALLDQFPDRNSFTTICNEDLSDALQQIAELLKEAIGNPCIQATLREPIECSVSDVVHPGADNQTETLLPECNAAEDLDTTDSPNSTNLPCWHLETDTASCAETPTNYALLVERGGISPQTGTHVQAHCVTCVDEDQNGTCDDAE